MSLSLLREFLDQKRAKYLLMSHSAAHTASGITAMMQIPGREVAKAVVVKADGRLVMAVVPASSRVDVLKLKGYLEANTVELVTEAEFRDRFPDCETGAIPPFGNLYGMEVFADERLALDREITFTAGSHRLLVWMNYADFEDLVRPVLMPLTVPNARASAV